MQFINPAVRCVFIEHRQDLLLGFPLDNHVAVFPKEVVAVVRKAPAALYDDSHNSRLERCGKEGCLLIVLQRLFDDGKIPLAAVPPLLRRIKKIPQIFETVFRREIRELKPAEFLHFKLSAVPLLPRRRNHHAVTAGQPCTHEPSDLRQHGFPVRGLRHFIEPVKDKQPGHLPKECPDLLRRESAVRDTVERACNIGKKRSTLIRRPARYPVRVALNLNHKRNAAVFHLKFKSLPDFRKKRLRLLVPRTCIGEIGGPVNLGQKLRDRRLALAGSADHDIAAFARGNTRVAASDKRIQRLSFRPLPIPHAEVNADVRNQCLHIFRNRARLLDPGVDIFGKCRPKIHIDFLRKIFPNRIKKLRKHISGQDKSAVGRTNTLIVVEQFT